MNRSGNTTSLSGLSRQFLSLTASTLEEEKAARAFPVHAGGSIRSLKLGGMREILDTPDLTLFTFGALSPDRP